MANLSNINNKFLFTDGDFLKIGNLAPINNISGTESGISITNGNCASITLDNSAAQGKTFVIYSAVNGSLNFFDADAASGRLIIDSSGNSTFAGNVSITKASTPELILTDTTNNVNLLIAVDDANTFLRSSSGAPILFQTNAGTTALTLDASQNATFASTIDAGGRIRVSGSNTDQYYLEGTRTGVGVTYRLYDNANNIYHDSWSTQVVRLNQNGGSGGNFLIMGGDVGIGTSPIEKLQVKVDDTTNNSFQGINVWNNATSGARAGISFKCYDWVQSAIWHGRYTSAAYNGALVLGTNPNTSDLTVGGVTGRMWILNNGNIGIGTDSPTNLLTINDPNANSSITDTIPSWWGLVIDRAYTTSSSAGMGIIGGTVATGSSGRLYLGNSDNVTHTYIDGGATQMHFAVAGGERMRIAYGGNVGIGTTGPLNKLQVNGDIGIGEINSARSTNVRFAKNDTNVITFDISVGAIGAWRPGSCWIQVSGAQNGLQEYWSAWYFIRLTHYYLSGVAGQGTTNPSCILDSGGNTSSVVVGVSSTNTSNPQIITITLTDVGGTTNSMVADINCTMQVGINSIT